MAAGAAKRQKVHPTTPGTNPLLCERWPRGSIVAMPCGRGKRDSTYWVGEVQEECKPGDKEVRVIWYKEAKEARRWVRSTGPKRVNTRQRVMSLAVARKGLPRRPHDLQTEGEWCDGLISVPKWEERRLNLLAACSWLEDDGETIVMVCPHCKAEFPSSHAASVHLQACEELDQEASADAGPSELLAPDALPLRCMVGDKQMPRQAEEQAVEILTGAFTKPTPKALKAQLRNESGRSVLVVLTTRHGAVAGAAVAIKEPREPTLTLGYAATHRSAAGVGVMRLLVAQLRRAAAGLGRRLVVLSTPEREKFWQCLDFVPSDGRDRVRAAEVMYPIHGAIAMVDEPHAWWHQPDGDHFLDELVREAEAKVRRKVRGGAAAGGATAAAAAKAGAAQAAGAVKKGGGKAGCPKKPAKKRSTGAQKPPKTRKGAKASKKGSRGVIEDDDSE